MARGYSSYRGRRSKAKTALVVLLVLIILAAAGVIFLQRFVVYDDMGTPQLKVPAAEPSAPGGADMLPGEVDITIENAETEQAQAEAETVFRAVQLAADPALWAAQMQPDTAVCVTVKSSGGKLHCAFAARAAGQVRAELPQEALSALLAGNGYAVARLSCLRDGGVARANVEAMSLKNTGGFVFYDGRNENWLDPAKQATRTYLAALAAECAAMGFDEILLTDLSYPTEGKLDKIAYGGEIVDAQWRVDQLAGLVAAVREAVGEDVRLSVEVPAAVLENGGVDAVSGIDLQRLEQVDRIYVPAAAEAVEALRQAVPDGITLILEVESLPAENVSCLLMAP